MCMGHRNLTPVIFCLGHLNMYRTLIGNNLSVFILLSCRVVKRYRCRHISLHRVPNTHAQCGCTPCDWWRGTQGGHGTGKTGKTGNLTLTFSRQGKHREFCCDTGKIFETQGKYFDCILLCECYIFMYFWQSWFQKMGVCRWLPESYCS